MSSGRWNAGQRGLPVVVPSTAGELLLRGHAGHQRLRGHGVIVVNMNYRLGELGWLTQSGSPQSRRRVGQLRLMDQLGLRWGRNVRGSAAPSNITLMGFSPAPSTRRR